MKVNVTLVACIPLCVTYLARVNKAAKRPVGLVHLMHFPIVTENVKPRSKMYQFIGYLSICGIWDNQFSCMSVLIHCVEFGQQITHQVAFVSIKNLSYCDLVLAASNRPPRL